MCYASATATIELDLPELFLMLSILQAAAENGNEAAEDLLIDLGEQTGVFESEE